MTKHHLTSKNNSDSMEVIDNADHQDSSFPVGWRSLQINKFADVRAGNAFPYKYQGDKSGRYPFFKVSDMTLPGNDVYMTSANNWIDENTLSTLKAKTFPKNTVVFPKVGAAVHTNKKRLLGLESLVDNNVMGIIVREDDVCLPEFLYLFFIFINISDLSNPGPLPSITASTVQATKVPLPTLPEQRAIARALRTEVYPIVKTKMSLP